MKTKTLFSLLFIALILIAGCSEDSSTEVEEKDGLIEFKTLNPMASMQKSTPFLAGFKKCSLGIHAWAMAGFIKYF